MNLYNDLSKARLYEKVYKPAFDKAETALTAGADPKKYHGNEWNYALAMVNKSKQLKSLSKKHGRQITITDVGPSENEWRFTMNKQSVLEQIRQEAFDEEMNKMAESDDEVVSRMARLGRGLRQGAGKGKGMPGGMRRNMNTGGCAAGGPGKSQGGGRGKGQNRQG